MRTVLFFLLLLPFTSIAQNGQLYQIYTNKGKKVELKKMVSKLSADDVILFGELHNNVVGHWLQLQLVEQLGKKETLILGAEMFEADNKDGLSDYVANRITEEEFVKNVRLWNNYKTDYKPLVEYARANNLAFIATNVPRRFANMVYKQGLQALDTLSITEKSWIAPLPFPYDEDLPNYKKMLTMFSDHGSPTLPLSQAIKDATMAYFIVEHKLPNQKFVHFNGTYHSNNYEGISWYLNKYKPGLKIGTIAMVESENVEAFDKANLDLADFIIVIDSRIIKSF